MLPTYFLSHGGGPWPWIEGPMRSMFDALERSLKDIFAVQVPQLPKAVLVVSGHWEEPRFTVSSGPMPGMVYDYYGFPEHTYHIKYPAPGSPVLARHVAGMMAAAGIDCRSDPERGFDHGTFSLMQAMRPQADIPVVQLSLKQGYDPAEHIAAGHAIAALREEGVLIIGSGLSWHNLRMRGPAAADPSSRFDAWLEQALVDPTMRETQLLNWAAAPGARLSHPSEDHLIPLMVAVGAAKGSAATRVYHQTDLFGSITASSYRFD
ncbi:class III extradiol ring-cleavage dioxygenase [Sphingobium sp. MK2]|uniref:DODA-type extradiol aromatic ring-opening family dioxygenase n=1 Tax=Sphingobium sp. MK2 TaxID=3116540 RepID=UPI0032E364FA